MTYHGPPDCPPASEQIDPHRNWQVKLDGKTMSAHLRVRDAKLAALKLARETGVPAYQTTPAGNTFQIAGI